MSLSDVEYSRMRPQPMQVRLQVCSGSSCKTMANLGVLRSLCLMMCPAIFAESASGNRINLVYRLKATSLEGSGNTAGVLVAGVCPMDAYLGHALSIRRQHGYLDHNQAVWEAAKTTGFEPGADGYVPIISTPMESYFLMAVRLQGKSPRYYPLKLGQLPSRFYIESRPLMRFQFALRLKTAPMEDFFSMTALRPATLTDWQGVTILRGDANSHTTTNSLSATLGILNETFGGDEFRVESPGMLQKIPEAWAGKKLVLASRGNFTVTTGQNVKSANISSAAFGNWQACEISPLRAGEGIRLQNPSPETIVIAISVFPEWMSLQRFQGPR
jgi:hypothetical protein